MQQARRYDAQVWDTGVQQHILYADIVVLQHVDETARILRHAQQRARIGLGHVAIGLVEGLLDVHHSGGGLLAERLDAVSYTHLTLPTSDLV